MPYLANIEHLNHGLREYQIKAKEEIYNSWNDGNRSVLLQMPTGTGKTRLFTSIIREFTQVAISEHSEAKFLVVAHREELISQAKAELSQQYNIHCGIIKAQYPEEFHKPVQIASIQTLRNRKIRGDVKLVIVDEAHHATANTYRDLWERFPNARFLGVTATPFRLDGSGLSDLFDDLITSPQIDYFIKKMYLSNVKYYAVPDSKLPDLSNVRTTAGDYNDKDLIEEIGNNEIIQSKLIESYKKYVNDKKGIVYTINHQHSEMVKSAYEAHGIPAEIVDANTSADERTKIIEDFKNGYLKVLCNVDIFTEGFDCPDIDFVQLARPSKSLTKYLQQVGRCMRTSPGKTYGYVLDNVGMYKENGLFNNNWDWESYFYGEATLDRIQERNNGKNEEDHSFEITEGDENMALINTAIEVELPNDTELTLKDLFTQTLRKRFELLINLGYSENQVYEAVKPLHPEEYFEAEGLFNEYQQYASELSSKSNEVYNIEQEIAEIENSLKELENIKSEIDYRQILKNLNDEVYLVYETLSNLHEEGEVIKKLFSFYPEIMRKAVNIYEEKMEIDNNEKYKELNNKLELKKEKLQKLKIEEKELTQSLNYFIQSHHPSLFYSDENQKTSDTIKISRSSNKLTFTEAQKKAKEEFANLKSFLIKNHYQYLGGKLLEQYGIIEKQLANEEKLSSSDKDFFKKIILRQIHKAGYELKHPDFIQILKRSWNNDKGNNNSVTADEQVNNKQLSTYDQFIENLKLELSTIDSDAVNLHNNQKFNLQVFLNDNDKAELLDDVLKILNTAVIRGHQINIILASRDYILQNKVTDKNIMHLLANIYLLGMQEPVFHYEVTKDLAKVYNISHQQIYPIALTYSTNKNGFFTHKKYTFDQRVHYSRIGGDVGRYINENFSLQDYENNKENVINRIKDEFPQYTRSQIEYLLEKTFKILI